MIETKKSLSTIIKTNDFNTNDIITIIDGVLSALEPYHSSGLIHGNVNPESILLTNNLNDIELVPNFNLKRNEHLNQEYLLMYHSPEQIRKEIAPLTIATDCYSVGLIIYELLTKEPVIKKGVLHQMRYSQITESPKILYQENNKVSKELSNFIMECIAKNPNERPTSAIEMRKTLRNLNQKNENNNQLFNINRLNEINTCYNFIDEKALNILWISGESGSGKSTLFHQAIYETFIFDWTIIKIENDYNFVDKKPHLLERICKYLTSSNHLQFDWFNEKNPLEAKANQLIKSKEIISKFIKSKQIIICVDDIQWVNKQEINDLISIVTELTQIKLILISHFEPAKEILKCEIKHIELETLDNGQLYSIFKNKLTLTDGSLNELIDIIQNIGHGNPLHIQRTIDYLINKNAIVFKDKSWHCYLNETKHLVSQMGSNTIIEQQIKELSKQSQQLIFELSLIGRIIKKPLLEELISTSLKSDLLDELTTNNLLINVEDSLKFSHSQIRFTIIECILTEEQENIHKHLLSKLLNQPDELKIKFAVNIAFHTNNIRKEKLNDINENELITIYDKAAKIAKHQGNYIEAIRFYQQKIEYTDHWKDYLDLGLCLELSGDIETSESALLTAIQKKDSDKSLITWHVIRLMIRLGKHKEAINYGLLTLKNHNINIDEYSDTLYSFLYLIKTKWILNRSPLDSFRLQKKDTDDPLDLILAQLIAPSFMENKHLMIPIIYHLFKRMINNGPTVISGFTMSCWGLVLTIIGKKKLAL